MRIPIAAVLVLLLTTSCSIFQRDCTPTLQHSTPYTFSISDQTTEATANIGVAQRGDQTFIIVRDSGDHQTEIRMEIVEPLAVGELNIPDPTASYPSDFVPPIEVRGSDPEGFDGGLFFGGITITALTDTTVSGSFDFRLARPNIDPVMLQGEFTDLEIQPCG